MFIFHGASYQLMADELKPLEQILRQTFREINFSKYKGIDVGGVGIAQRLSKLRKKVNTCGSRESHGAYVSGFPRVMSDRP
jgi:hypothetical protein